MSTFVVFGDREQRTVLVDDGLRRRQELRALPFEFADVAQQLRETLLGALENALGIEFGAAEDDVGFLLGATLDLVGDALRGDHGFFEGFFAAAVVLDEASRRALVFTQLVVLARELFHFTSDEVQERIDLGLVETAAETGAKTLLLDVKRCEAHGGTIWSHMAPAKFLTRLPEPDQQPLPGASTVSYCRAMTFENLLVEDAGAVRVITVNRPAALNAINRATMLELGRAFAELRDAPGIRAAIVTGGGEKSFVAGADITEFNSLSPDEARAYSRIGHNVFASVAELDIPVIAAVNGFALGGGLELALACDFIYASDNARLGLVEANLGLIPGFGGVARLARRVGTAMAAEMIMSAAQVKADEALRIGLANKVLPLADLMTTAKKTAETMAAKGPLAIGAVKRLLREGENADLRVANSAEQTAFGLAFSTEDRRIGVDAFLAKSKEVAFVGR